MSENADNSTFLKRYLALKTLRENVFLNNPTAYGLLDIAEDIPGAGRGIAPFLSDTLPSAALLSSDPDKRKQQVSEAVQKIKATKDDSSELKKQMLTNALSMFVTGIPTGLAVSGGFNLLGLRSPFKGGLRSPITLGRNIHKLRNSTAYRKALLSRMGEDASKGAVLAGVSGALTPLIASKAQFTEQDLAKAETILNKYPISSSLPAGDVLSAMPDRLSKGSVLENTGAGAGIGMLMGAVGTAIPPALSAPKELIKSPHLSTLANLFARSARKSLLGNTALLGALGGVAGYTLAKQNTQNDQVQTSVH
jgi:hypothetical protein